MDREILPVYILFPLEVVQIFKVANFVYYGTLAWKLYYFLRFIINVDANINSTVRGDAWLVADFYCDIKIRWLVYWQSGTRNKKAFQ